MVSVNTFSELRTNFLEPLITRRHIHCEEIPLEQMTRWNFTNGRISSSFFNLIGIRTTFEEDDAFQARTWDQPIYRQETGTLVLFVDEEKRLLVRAVFEPGNSSRGYQNKGLTLSNSCKFSPGNLAYLQSRGQAPPLSELVEHPAAIHHFSHPAPGDGGRADKQNEHHLIQIPQAVLKAAADALPQAQSDFFALLPLQVFQECYQHGLVNEHLRDVASMLLFLK